MWHEHHTGQFVLRSLTAYDHCRRSGGQVLGEGPEDQGHEVLLIGR
ncbi:hypothetical protein ABZ357_20145 [Streptomyces sp. NPDC005917]